MQYGQQYGGMGGWGAGQQYGSQYGMMQPSMYGHQQYNGASQYQQYNAAMMNYSATLQPMMLTPSGITPQHASMAAAPISTAASVPAATSSAAVSAPVAKAEPVVVDARRLLLPPGRLSRPRRVLVVLRGPPGSGKSHAARLIREVEAEHGVDPPRVLSLDEYYITVRGWEYYITVRGWENGGKQEL